MHARPIPIGELADRYPSLAVSGYQRAIVWGPTQRAALVRSLLEDYPTGLIVLNKIADGKRRTKPGRPLLYLPRVEIIDGQQRLTTILEFLRNPLMYFTEWAPHLPRNVEEPKEVRAVRDAFDALFKVLRRKGAQFAPPKVGRKDLFSRIGERANRELTLVESGKSVEDPRFHELVQTVCRLKSRVSKCRVVVQELEGLDSTEAERIYDVINSSGTRLKWWELLWGRELFVHTPYGSTEAYRTRWDDQVERVAQFYRLKNLPRDSPIKAAPAETMSLWHAMYALGHYYYCKFQEKDPKTTTRVGELGSEKPRVDGIGFRLVSTFLSHDVGRAAVYDMPEQYSPDQIRRAIDILFDTAETVFSAELTGGYKFFTKYAGFYADPLPAYPVVGLVVAASKFVARNREEGTGSKLSSKDSTALRALTEELFRETICSSKWSGTGDARLREWLNLHFEPVTPQTGEGGGPFPGKIRPIEAGPTGKLWAEFIRKMGPTGKRTTDRSVASFMFWCQYILDSASEGTLPRGIPQYDHIVPFSRDYRETTHPLNVAAISADLNRSKGSLTYAGWGPSEEQDLRYRRQTICRPGLSDAPASVTADFLEHASFTHIREMLDGRRRVFEYLLASFLPRWISDGD